jgi:D-alanyl-D-alanine carboxypeptidase
MLRNGATILLMAFGIGACVAGAVEAMPAGSRSPAGHTKRTQGDAALQRALERVVQTRGGPPGAAAIVQRGRHRELVRAGVGNVDTGRSIRAGDHMRIASVSKAFSGAVALRLVQRGKLSLQSRIGHFLRKVPKKWRRITLTELLQHTSGLPDYTGVKAFLDKFLAHPHKRWRPREVLAFVLHKKLNFSPPGSEYKYSNTDNLVVGLMVHAATHSGYRQQLRRRVLRPLSLDNTNLPAGFRLPHPSVRGYSVDPPHPPEDVTGHFGMSSLWASGGMQSTPAELNRFMRAYAGGRLYGSGIRGRQLRFVKGASDPQGPGRNSAGLGIFRYHTGCGTVYGHTGNFFGYTQFAAATRNGRRSATVSVNSQSSDKVGPPRVFKAVRHAFAEAVCAALGP